MSSLWLIVLDSFEQTISVSVAAIESVHNYTCGDIQASVRRNRQSQHMAQNLSFKEAAEGEVLAGRL